MYKRQEKAEALCRRLAECSSGSAEHIAEQAALITQLNKIDEEIKNGFAKDLVAVLFFNDENSADGSLPPIAAAEKVYGRIRQMALQVCTIFKNR